jgi:eukaryotic-like serine/threonine-protein kinase
MSRVFVADETAFGRKVVVKVLPPDLAAGVSVDRFKREIQVAARLQHPHIVPVLSAGEMDGLPFYTMPLVEGSSLRARLARGGFSITEVTGILREIARALAYAHERGVVHRDIKPDNVLLTGGSAVVTDFGIAKALSAARTESMPAGTLTQMGTSLGTPAYMAPEQAAADPAMDHRADIYAFGATAFELLTGHPPFHGLSPQKMLAAHMGEQPPAVAALRPDTPPLLAELVMRCLEKDPARRPQSASDLARVLETVTSGSSAPMPQVLIGGRRTLPKALAIYALAFVVVLILARAAIVGIGLPPWVFPGAVIVMAMGLPVILFTAFVHNRTHRALTSTPALTPGGSPLPRGTMATIALKASPHVSWRRTTLGGAAAIGALVLLTAGWMTLRALGLGPAGSLIAAGALGDRERIILADFTAQSDDSLLAQTVTEAFRTDLAQSASISLMPANAVREVLARMQRPRGTVIDFNLAREIATREGIKAIVTGNVVEVFGSYVLSAKLVSAQTGEELATFREEAREPKDMVPAIGRLSRSMRSRVGESLKTIQQARTLEKVTTPSLQALQKYVAGTRALEVDGEFDRGVNLVEEAIALDSGFAMAYRKLAVELNNRGLSRARVTAAIQKAYDHRDRLSDSERYLTIAAYYQFGPSPDRARIVSAYESLLDVQPENVTALNNLAAQYRFAREYAKAEALARRAIDVQPAYVFYNNLVSARFAQGKDDEAKQAARDAAAALPRNPWVAFLDASIAMRDGRIDDAMGVLDSVRKARPNDLDTQSRTGEFLSAGHALRGQLAEALRWASHSNAASAQQGNRSSRLHSLLDEAEVDVWYRGEKERALRTVERALAEYPLDSLAALERPHVRLARIYALADRPDRARAMLAAFDRRHAETAMLGDDVGRALMVASIAMAERRYDDAIRVLRQADHGSCMNCSLPLIGQSYDLAGNVDSARAVFARYVSDPVDHNRYWLDAQVLPGIHKRLGELHELKGDRQSAMSHYSAFIELWKGADPELQPMVRDARQRLAALQRQERQ